MKAKIHVTLKPGILDPQGKAIEHALATLGYQSVRHVRVGKHIELELDENAIPDADAHVKAMCEKLLANTIIEEYAYELESAGIQPLSGQRADRRIVIEEEPQPKRQPEPERLQTKPAPIGDTVIPPLATNAAIAMPPRLEEQTSWASASAKPCQDTKAQEDARGLAKRILADLASLNPKAVDEGVRSGTFRQLLKDDLDEGLRLFRQQVQESVRMQHDYFGEAVDEFVDERQRTLGMK